MINKNYPASDAAAAVPTSSSLVKGGTVFVIELSGKHRADKDFFLAVQLQSMEGASVMNPNALFTARKLCGDGFWDDLAKPERWLAGRCVAFMVVNGMLPFQFDNTKSGSTKRYRLN